MRIGFTGTQDGMSRAQQFALIKVLDWYMEGSSEFHHGKCIGADAQAHLAAVSAGFRIVLHPPIRGRKEALCAFYPEAGDVLMPRKDYLERNKNIVNSTEVPVACPKEEDGEALRSGTWSTVRYARSLKRKIVSIRPSGKIEVENDNTGTDLES